jgi:hypothetical protein
MTYTYLTLGSWECGAENRKGKILSLLFPHNGFCYLDNRKHGTFLIVFVLKCKQYLYVLVPCVYCDEAKDMPTSSRIMALG